MTPQALNSGPRIVLDSNVVLDWLVFGNPGVAPVCAAIVAGELHWLTSTALRDELAAVLALGHLAAWSPDEARLWATWDRWAQPVVPVALQGAALRMRCRDRDDQKFIDLALGHGARWLLSRDKAVLALARRVALLGLCICTPEHWATEAASPAPTAAHIDRP